MIGVKRVDHVFISVPLESIAAVRNYYSDVLELHEILGNHPDGAIWFQVGDIQLHIREEESHQTDSDRHIAFEVDDLEVMKVFLKRKDITITFSTVIKGRDRCFFRDPWGNRFELISFDDVQ